MAQKLFSYRINGVTKRSVCFLVNLPRVNGSCETCIFLTAIWSVQETDQCFLVRVLRLTNIEICCEWHLRILHATWCYSDQCATVQTPRHTSAVAPNGVRSVSTTWRLWRWRGLYSFILWQLTSDVLLQTAWSRNWHVKHILHVSFHRGIEVFSSFVGVYPCVIGWLVTQVNKIYLFFWHTRENI